MIYSELERRESRIMSKVVALGTLGAVLLYTSVGVFGYWSFVHDNHAHDAKNILEVVGYKNHPAMAIGKIAILFAIVSAAPLCLLPAKDTCEELWWKKNGMNKKINFFITLILTFACWFLAIFIKTIGDAMTLSGATI